MPRSSPRAKKAGTSVTGTTPAAMPDALRDDNAHGRKTITVDLDVKRRNTQRLRRIEGQVRGLQRMVDEDRYCADILTQIASVQEALRAVGKELMRHHLRHCATHAMQQGPEAAEAMYDELVELMTRAQR